MPQYAVGEAVGWPSRSGLYHTHHRGIIRAVVPAGASLYEALAALKLDWPVSILPLTRTSGCDRYVVEEVRATGRAYYVPNCQLVDLFESAARAGATVESDEDVPAVAVGEEE